MASVGLSDETREFLLPYRVGYIDSVYVIPDFIDERRELELVNLVSGLCKSVWCPISCFHRLMQHPKPNGKSSRIADSKCGVSNSV